MIGFCAPIGIVLGVGVLLWIVTKISIQEWRERIILEHEKRAKKVDLND